MAMCWRRRLRCQVLLWLSLQGLGPDGTLSSSELLPRGPTPRGRRSAAAASSSSTDEDDGSGSGTRSATTASSSSTDEDDGSGSGTRRATTASRRSRSAGPGESVWHQVPPSPGGGVLGTGITGEVLSGRQVCAPKPSTPKPWTPNLKPARTPGLSPARHCRSWGPGRGLCPVCVCRRSFVTPRRPERELESNQLVYGCSPYLTSRDLGGSGGRRCL